MMARPWNSDSQIRDGSIMPGRTFKKAVQPGRSERKGEAYSCPYVEPLSDARTTLAAFFNVLWERQR